MDLRTNFQILFMHLCTSAVSAQHPHGEKQILAKKCNVRTFYYTLQMIYDFQGKSPPEFLEVAEIYSGSKIFSLMFFLSEKSVLSRWSESHISSPPS